MDTGFTLPLFQLGVDQIAVFLMTDKVHKRGCHCTACTVMAVSILCQDGNTKASVSVSMTQVVQEETGALSPNH